MRLLFVTLAPFYPDSAGGAHKSHLNLFEGLLRRGWEIEVLCGLPRHSRYRNSYRRLRFQALTRVSKPSPYVQDTDLGYGCWRGIRSRQPLSCLLYKSLRHLGMDPGRFRVFRGFAAAGTNVFSPGELRRACEFLGRRLTAFKPDIVLGHHGVLSLVSYAAASGFAGFFLMHGTRGRRAIPDGVHVIANSPITASIAEAGSSNEVGLVLPLVNPDSCRSNHREGDYITFINPIPDKGLETAVEIARRLPNERFLFVDGDIFGAAKRFSAWLRLGGLRALPNVTVWNFQDDVRRVYSATDILLFPSRHESFGSAILEAHINGIPVVAASIGGIPYTIGRAGVLIKPGDDVEAYARAIARLRSDNAHYADLSRLAIENSRRPEFAPEHQLENFIGFVTSRRPRTPRIGANAGRLQA